MVSVPNNHPANKTLHCPHCRYNLTGLSKHLCPECGTPFDPSVLRAHTRRYWAAAIILTHIVIYAPYGWLLFVQDDPGYVRNWMKLWPVLPGLPLTFLIGGLFNSAPGNWPLGLSLITMGAISLTWIVLCAWLGSRSVRALVVTLLITLVLSVINSWFAHVIFAA